MAQPGSIGAASTYSFPKLYCGPYCSQYCNNTYSTATLSFPRPYVHPVIKLTRVTPPLLFPRMLLVYDRQVHVAISLRHPTRHHLFAWRHRTYVASSYLVRIALCLCTSSSVLFLFLYFIFCHPPQSPFLYPRLGIFSLSNSSSSSPSPVLL